MKNEKGVTLVELLVVVAISAVLLVGIIIGLSSVFSNKAKSASKEIYSMLGVTQNMGRSKNNAFMALKSDGKGGVTAYVLDKKSDGTFVVVEENNFSKVPVDVVVGTATKAISDSYGVMLAIDRKTGGFNKAYNCAGGFSDASTAALGSSCSKIIVHGSSDYTIAISSTTGKYYYE